MHLTPAREARSWAPADDDALPAPAAASRPVPRRLVLVPAHDEGALISATVASVVSQTRAGDRVVVIADNCTDDTALLAVAAGAEVMATVGNTHKKAGALNQVLARLLPTLDADDAVLVMDADTTLHPGFLDAATAALEEQDVAAAGGVFHGEPGRGLVGQLQRNEYARYARQLSRTGRVCVLTGTGTVFRVSALREVVAARAAGVLPGGQGQVYDTLALTEDNELTLALKTLGHRLASPAACGVTTEVMPSWGRLWQQRLRWQRGAIDNLSHYGLTRTTLPYVGQQLMMAVGVVMLSAYLLLLSLTLVQGGSFVPSPFWSAVTAVFVVERVVTVRSQGWRAMLLATPLVVEMVYDAFLQVVLVQSAYSALRRREAGWGAT